MNLDKELNHAEAELLKLEQQKSDIERQMRGWIQVIEGLRVLNEPARLRLGRLETDDSTALELPSLPSKVLTILAHVSAPIGATQIRDHLVASRAADATAKNLLINIHTTLKRLIKAGQVEEVPLADGTKLYQYVSPMKRAIRIPAYGASNSLAAILAGAGLTANIGQVLKETLRAVTEPNPESTKLKK